MTVKDSQNGKIVILSKAFDNRAKILNGIYGVVFCTGAFLLLHMVILSEFYRAGPTIFSIGMSIGFLVISYRFIKKALFAEKLYINKNLLTISKGGFLYGSSFSYDISLISNFRHLDKPEITKHPLAGESFDYFGFQTEQKVINEMHGDNRLAFDYNGTTITFGENIYSWEFGELEVLLYDITGNDFRYTDEFEKTFKPEDDTPAT